MHCVLAAVSGHALCGGSSNIPDFITISCSTLLYHHFTGLASRLVKPCRMHSSGTSTTVLLTSFLSQVVGGMTWCIQMSNFDVDVDLLFQENSTIGQKM